MEYDEIKDIIWRFEDITRELGEAIGKFIESKAAEAKPLNERRDDLTNEVQRRAQLVAELRNRVTQEQVLGVPLTSDKTGVTPNELTARTDWSQIVQNNVTRIGAILLTIFLVTILVPQYRYNIRMASFYNARADSLLISTRADDDLSKLVTIMTPNIDFGKAPPTPVEQIVEAIKAVKS